MSNILQGLRTRLRYKIIIPFLALTLVVALVGYFVAFYFTAKSAQEEFDNSLAEVSRITNHALVNQERANLQFLIEVVFAPASNDNPSVSDAVDQSDQEKSVAALTPYFRSGMTRPMLRLDRLIAFDKTGKSLADFERDSNAANDTPDGAPTSTAYILNRTLDFSGAWFVPDILSGEEDTIGDKYAGMIQLPSDTTGEHKRYFATIAPVLKGDQVVGGIIVAMEADQLLLELRERSRGDIVAFFDESGKARVSTLQPENGLDAFDIPADVLETIKKTVQTDDSTDAVYDVQDVDGVQYQFAYTKLRIRSDTVGILGVTLNRDIDTWKQARLSLLGITIALMLGVIGVGVVLARHITSPLDELVQTARDVTAGNFQRRSTITSSDEIGVLSEAFNQMTEHLLALFGRVLAESGQRAAIVESIADGIIVCDNNGIIQLVNRATYELLGIENQKYLPGRLSDLPLTPVTENIFGSQQPDMYKLGNYYIKISVSPVITADNVRMGDVYVLQNMTDEVSMDRAKTGFIATISHEMRTPLTSMRGNADMLIHGLAGPLQPEQLPMVETISQQTNNMTRLVNNMVIIAGLESGSMVVEPETISLKRSVEEALWPTRKGLKAKNLSLTIEVPPDIDVDADRIQLRNILQQLVDNARVYTDEGGITVRAVPETDFVRIDVIDTGCGIEEALIDNVFERFVRGEGSNDRPDRGIGLGLAIVEQLVEQHGGRVWVTSKPGEGSTFSFTLRYAKEPDSPEPEKEPVAEAA